MTLVTGGTGLVGRYLITALRRRGDTVRALVLPTEDASWLEDCGVAISRGDIRNADTLISPMKGVDIVFHLAAMQGAWLPIQEYHKVNVVGTENVCRAALDACVRRVVHVSSWTIYGLGHDRPLTEDIPPAPWRDPYWMTKAQGDLLVQRMIARDRLPAVIIRPGTIFGPADRLNFGRIADRLRWGRGVIIGSGHNVLSLVYVTDVVQGLLLCADVDRAEGEAYNITNDRQLTQREFLRAIAQELGAAPPRLHIPYRLAYWTALVAERTVTFTRSDHPVVTRHGIALFGTSNRHSIEKARAELGYAPQVSIREGIRLACNWYEANQLLATNLHARRAHKA